MVRAFIGAIMVVGGIAAFIETGSHAPGSECVDEISEPGNHTCLKNAITGWSHNAYDLVRIGGWALIIIGALLIVFGLIAYVRNTQRD
jgi:hypothetical protein